MIFFFKYNLSLKNYLKQILFFLILFLSTLLMLEFFLRATHFTFVFQQKKKNQIYQDDSKKIRIVTLGESTTADDDFDFDENLSWPRLLENKLISLGANVRVYNLGVTATTTSRILSKLPEELEYYKPHIVISMMGVNDNKQFAMKNEGLLYNFKIVNLYRWIKRELYEKYYPQPESYQDFINSKSHFFRDFDFKKLSEILEENSIEAGFLNIEILLNGLDQKTKAAIISKLALDYFESRNDKNNIKRKLIYKYLLEKSLNYYFAFDLTIEKYSHYLAYNAEYSSCFQLATKFIDKYPIMSDFLFLNFEGCAKQDDQKKLSQWFEILAHNREINSQFKKYTDLNFQNGETAENFQKLYFLLDAKKIKFIVMQYPNLKINELKKYFSLEQQLNINFLENYDNFRSAIEIHSWDKVFKDKFALQFGHTTKFGHELISNTVTEHLLKEKIIK